MTQTGSLFDHFMPHGMCYQWRPDILWLNVLSDLFIAASYFCIAFAIFYYLCKRSAVTYKGVYYMFCVFIVSCGLVHVVSIWTVWHGQYGLQGIVKALTAVASIATAITLYPVMPKLLALRSPSELALTNSALEGEIRQRRQSELQSLRLQGELARVGRISTLGQMATGLAHELNQPLLAISASTDTAVKAVQDVKINNNLLGECLEDIRNETHRAADIIKSLRLFVSKKAPLRKEAEINSVVSGALRLMQHDVSSANIELGFEPYEKLPLVTMDSVQISQVVISIVRNAIEAHTGDSFAKSRGKLIDIKTLPEERSVCIEIADNGPGIEVGIDPFELLESQKKDGIGVGLSISRDIVESHGGKLIYEKNQDAGVTFKVCIPYEPGGLSEVVF